MTWRRALALIGIRVQDQPAREDPDAIYVAGYRAGHKNGRQAEALEWHAALFERDDEAGDWPDAARWAPDRTARPAPLADLPGDGQPVVLTGYLVDVVRHVNRAGYTWAQADLEVDEDQVVGVRVFPQLYDRVGVLVCEDEAVTVSGRVDLRDGGAVVIASELARVGA